MRLLLAAVSLTVALFPAVAAAQRHDVRGLVSPKGLDFLAGEVPKFVPKHLSPPDLMKQVACVEAFQRDTEVDLQLGGFEMSIPEPGRIRLDLTLSATGTGELYAQDILACLGDLTCQDDFSIQNARAIIELDVELVSGQPRVAMASVDVQLAANDVDLNISGCFAGDLVSWVLDFAKGFFMDALVGKIEQAAQDQIAPKIEELLGGLGYGGSVGSTQFDAILDNLLLSNAGLAIGASIDVTTPYPADRCIAEYDDGDPSDLDGSMVDLTGAPETDVGVAANFGVVNDALYHVWRKGLACVNEDHLAALGVELPLEMVAELLPGFPPGTELGIEILPKAPVELVGAEAAGAGVTLAIKDLQITIVGRRPDGEETRVVVGVSATASAAVGIDPGSNALLGQVVGVTVDKLEMDQLTVSQTGFDVNRLKDVVETVLVPHVVEQMGQMALTGPVFSAAGYAIILRKLDTSDAYLGVKFDLFAIPTDDFTAPDTALTSYPIDLVSPKDAVIKVSGTDARIPLELLSYQVEVNGEARPVSFIREFKVGKAGESGTYEVRVAATDLSGNVDASPARISVRVDGKSPSLVLAGDRVRAVEGPIELAWRVSDDLTPPEAIGTTLVIQEVTDPSDLLATVEVERQVLQPGVTATSIDGLPPGHLYRIEIHAIDSVGNDSSASVLVDLRTGGCAAGGGASSGVGLIGLALAALLLRRRR